ncbi:hypothetical protein Godav_001009 [Gossypium davidsonii]|uniref:Uncharacterized protein n=2 Tax=Gossypium TaxID=3633 RepID=A0A7J8T1I0_GOSDV|nr:hypothetical protein [Gossypium davidsonii]MBA0667986.1 hypothetical protein [Gossypium klotzschianum]
MHSGNVLRRSPLPLVKRKIRSQTPHMKLTSLNKQLQGPHMKPKRRLNTRLGKPCRRLEKRFQRLHAKPETSLQIQKELSAML